MVKKQLFVSTLLLLIIAFAIGVIVGSNASNPELHEVNQVIKQSELSTESYLLEQELLEGFDQNCELAKIRLFDLSDELWQLGKMLGTDTAKQDLGEKNYHFLKLKYHLMQIKTYLLHYKLNRDCELDTSIVLFYYQQNNPDSKKQGEILDKLVDDYDIHVFAIEYNYSKELEFLELNHEITIAPSLMINYELKKAGLTSYDDIRDAMGLESET